MTPLRNVCCLSLSGALAVFGCREFASKTMQTDGGAGSPAAAGAAASEGGTSESAGGTSESAGARQVGGEANDLGGGPANHGGITSNEAGGWGGDDAEPSEPSAGGASGGQSGAGAAGENGSAAELAPSDFPGLALWLDAANCSYGSDSRASHCSDASGEGNEAVQPAAALQPKWLADDANGLPALLFDGGEAPARDWAASVLRIEDSASLQFAKADFSILLVARWNNVASSVYSETANGVVVSYAGYGSILAKVQPQYPYQGVALFANFPANGLDIPAYRRFVAQLEIASASVMSYQTSLNDNVWRIHTARRTNGTLSVRVGRQQESGTEISPDLDVSAAYVDMQLGGYDGSPFRGQLAELVIIRGSTSDTEIAALEQYLANKYAL